MKAPFSMIGRRPKSGQSAVILTTSPGAVTSGSLVDASASAMLEAAHDTELTQVAALETAPIDETYQATLETLLSAKYEQVERLEDRLENLIENQQARLQRTQAAQPGLLALPSSKRAWQAQQLQQQARLQVLHARLDTIRELKEGMTPHSPKLLELATRKLRAHQPTLADQWDAMQCEARKQALAHLTSQDRSRQQRSGAQALRVPQGGH